MQAESEGLTFQSGNSLLGGKLKVKPPSDLPDEAIFDTYAAFTGVPWLVVELNDLSESEEKRTTKDTESRLTRDTCFYQSFFSVECKYETRRRGWNGGDGKPAGR